MFGTIGLSGFAIFVAVALLAFVFWIWMLVDAVTQENNPHDRLVWVLIIILTHVVGAVIYFVVRRAPRARQVV